MANTLRCEVDISLGGKIYTMRPTFQALCEIEHSIGKSVLTLLQQFPEEGIMLCEQEAIIRAGVKAVYGVVPEPVGELIAEAGLVASLEAVCQFLHHGVCHG